MRATPAPFGSSSLGALRLLVGFALVAEEAAPARATLLAHAGAAGARPCEALLSVLRALRHGPVVPAVLDGLLAATLGREAARFARRSAPELAACWRERRDGLDGRELAALLWQVARRDGGAFRALEEEIACAITPLHLLSPQQRALALVHPLPAADGRRATRLQGDLGAA